MALAAKLHPLTSQFDHPISDPRGQVVRRTLDEWMTVFDPAAPTTVQVGDRLPGFTLQDGQGADVSREALLESISMASSSLSSPAATVSATATSTDAATATAPPSSATDSTPSSSSNKPTESTLPSPPLLLLTFIRGEWCGFCKIQLRELARRAPDFAAVNVRLVVVSPELPQFAKSTEKDYFSDVSPGSDGSAGSDDNTSTNASSNPSTRVSVLADVDNTLSRQLGLVWAQPQEMYPVLAGYGHDVPGRSGNEKYEVPVPATLLVDGAGVVLRRYVDADFMRRVEPDLVLGWVGEVRRGDK